MFGVFRRKKKTLAGDARFPKLIAAALSQRAKVVPMIRGCTSNQKKEIVRHIQNMETMAHEEYGTPMGVFLFGCPGELSNSTAVKLLAVIKASQSVYEEKGDRLGLIANLYSMSMATVLLAGSTVSREDHKIEYTMTKHSMAQETDIFLLGIERSGEHL